MSRRKRRRLGQHFLADRQIAERIVGLLADEPSRVVEIGPGRGALTEPLVERFERVLALEVDAELAAGLRERLADTPLEVVDADALREPLDPHLGGEAPWQVAGNLPYSVGSAIVRRLLPRHDLLSRIVVMLQQEVAERLVAVPGQRNHGLMALERAAHAEARIAFTVGRRAFRPQPRVMSSVLVFDLHPPAFDNDVLARAFTLASRALTRPRKKLRNALDMADAELSAAGVDPDARPGTLALEEWVGLAEALG
jgi:16S rRNA (adenine1518-N6/adenine1519-N6)-dimethyltransferase